ncbi:hypothetical protein L1274_003644 [Duganella sp. HSC-15S17]|uniref:Uncharacterized protein n=1 Tax=Duganella violaceipulchra TaxID=2849652 RepID=A0ABT1GLR3_9BURK|nr:hypothetical protein [Duganella violaceicalia]
MGMTVNCQVTTNMEAHSKIVKLDILPALKDGDSYGAA